MGTLAALELIEIIDLALQLSSVAFLCAAWCWYRLREFSQWCYLMIMANVALAATCFMWYRINQTRFTDVSTSELNGAAQRMVAMACLGIVANAVGSVQVGRRLRQQQRFWRELHVASAIEGGPSEKSR